MQHKDSNKQSWRVISMASFLLLLLLAGLQLVYAAPGDMEWVSVDSNGQKPSWGDSRYPSISGDGRFVAFHSDVNLASGVNDGNTHIFLRDRQTGITTRASVDSNGVQANESSFDAEISGDGHFITFYSFASNLVSSDTNHKIDVFVYDPQLGVTTRVSVGSSGNEGNGDSRSPSISGNGRFVTFLSDADNLVSGDTNGSRDIFVHDRQTGITTRISVSSDGVEGNGDSFQPAMSSDGRFVAFLSDADNLVSGDSNGKRDTFVHDRQTGQTMLVSITSAGVQANEHSYEPKISGDGRFVAFVSFADNLVSGDTNGQRDIFVRDQQTGTTTRASVNSNGVEGNYGSHSPSISSNGRFVIFTSCANNLVNADTNDWCDVFSHDQITGATIRVSQTMSGGEPNEDSEETSVSSNGRFIAFSTFATNLVSGDTDSGLDTYVVEQAITSASCDLSSGFNIIHGTPGNDKITGTAGNDIILGYGGNDRINGAGGDDCLIGGPGNDQLYGNEGDDILWGGEVGNATVYGSKDSDKLYGNDGNDELHGGGDKDNVNGDAGDDLLYGDDGDDTMRGQDGNDMMYGGAGRDNVSGDNGDDRLYGDAGDDRLYGRKGDDLLDGGSESDQLNGDLGVDRCLAGEKLTKCER